MCINLHCHNILLIKKIKQNKTRNPEIVHIFYLIDFESLSSTRICITALLCTKYIHTISSNIFIFNVTYTTLDEYKI